MSSDYVVQVASSRWGDDWRSRLDAEMQNWERIATELINEHQATDNVYRLYHLLRDPTWDGGRPFGDVKDTLYWGVDHLPRAFEGVTKEAVDVALGQLDDAYLRAFLTISEILGRDNKSVCLIAEDVINSIRSIRSSLGRNLDVLLLCDNTTTISKDILCISTIATNPASIDLPPVTIENLVILPRLLGLSQPVNEEMLDGNDRNLFGVRLVGWVFDSRVSGQIRKRGMDVRARTPRQRDYWESLVAHVIPHEVPMDLAEAVELASRYRFDPGAIKLFLDLHKEVIVGTTTWIPAREPKAEDL